MTDQEIYERFITWLGKAWVGLPESEHLIPTIKAFYTPEEAALLNGLPLSGKTLEALAEMKGMEPAELTQKLDDLAKRGAVWRSVKGNTVWYKLNDSIFTFMRGPFWATDPHPATKALASPFNRYFYDGYMDQFAKAHTKGLRTIPIDKTIEDPRQILPYEDVVQFLDSQNYYAVSYCPCRQRKNLDPDSPDCHHPLEVCLHFGSLGHYIVDNGLGREIAKEGAKDILTLAAESGLVHAISNWQEGADTICNCCRCCCLFLESYHVLKHDKSFDVSNYQVRTNPGTCKACGLCVERCPMDALELADFPEADNKKGKTVSVNDEKCLGCGVCVYKCPTQSLVLERREETTHPPKDTREWMERWFEDKKKAGGVK
jgi:Na+-translocating ferredoxin:NAD+ oxidoreductase subunit B